MKEFLKTNTVTYNLLSYTGFKSMLIFSQLMKSPKSYSELQEYLLNHEYLKENISIDSLRIYMNSLRKIGCDIVRLNVDGVSKFMIVSHPFNLKVTKAQARSIIKVYKAISKSIEFNDLMALQAFFEKISNYVDDESLKAKLQNLSPFNNIKIELIEELKFHAQNNNEITIYYHSLNSGNKNITLIVDKMTIRNGKLYICGLNSEYNNYSSFLVSRIIKILSVNLSKKTIEIPDIIAGYELEKDCAYQPELLENEKIISETEEKYIIEITSKNKFDIVQRVLSHMNKCKVLYPEIIKEEVILNLKKMKEGYLEQ